MTSHSKTRRLTEKQRQENAERACGAFMVWAKGDGKAELAITLEVRDWAIVIGSVTLHAADLLAGDGNPDLLISLATELADALRGRIGDETTDRILALVGEMVSGVKA